MFLPSVPLKLHAGPGQYNMEKYPKRLSRGVSISQLLPLREQKGVFKFNIISCFFALTMILKES